MKRNAGIRVSTEINNLLFDNDVIYVLTDRLYISEVL